MIIIFLILIFSCGFMLGFLITGLLGRKRDYIGTIVVDKQEDKIVYSLEMNDSPEILQFKKKAYFQIKISEEESNRR